MHIPIVHIAQKHSPICFSASPRIGYECSSESFVDIQRIMWWLTVEISRYIHVTCDMYRTYMYTIVGMVIPPNVIANAIQAMHRWRNLLHCRPGSRKAHLHWEMADMQHVSSCSQSAETKHCYSSTLATMQCALFTQLPTLVSESSKQYVW